MIIFPSAHYFLWQVFFASSRHEKRFEEEKKKGLFFPLKSELHSLKRENVGSGTFTFHSSRVSLKEKNCMCEKNETDET